MPDRQLDFGWFEPQDGDSPAGDGDSRAPATGRLPRAEALADKMARLAGRGAFVGTSSWKYPGWLGQIYTPQRYAVGGRFSRRRFDQGCLAEYAEVFRTVCGDYAFYRFPEPGSWARTFAALPAGFRFSLKVPEEVTAAVFPDLPRYGPRAGLPNPHFLDADLVRRQLLEPLEPFRDRLGVLIFEFGTIRGGPAARPAGFASMLDGMLSKLPCQRFQLAVEVRNASFLDPAGGYLDCLRAHGVAHCLNSWTRMPPVAEQLRLPGVFTAGHVVGRFLLRPGRTYAEAVRRFEPYDRLQDPYPQGRDALRELIASAVPGVREVYAFVNNRFEGSAIGTIESLFPDPSPAPEGP